MSARAGFAGLVAGRLRRSGPLRAAVHAWRRGVGAKAGPHPRTPFGRLADTVHWQLREEKDAADIEANARRLQAIAPTEVHRVAASELLEALRRRDESPACAAAALAIAATAMRETDRRAEKFVSRRYRCLWIANCKVASRSMVAALRAADPSAKVFKGLSVDELAAVHPEIAGYFSFAFVRHPYTRAYAFYADKIVSSRHIERRYRRFIEPYHGLENEFSFAEVCEWLNTPYGSDQFAERHWVSQDRTIRVPGGALPEFVGRFESLQEDWERAMARLGMPCGPLPHLNATEGPGEAGEHLDERTRALLRRRYADDFALGNYEA